MCKLFIVIVLATLATSCRDLGVSGERGGGPKLDFVNPLPSQTVPLTSFVQLLVQDPSGIPEVTLSCRSSTGAATGSVQIYSWEADPFQSTIDLTACSPGNDAGQAISETVLTAVAKNGLGRSTTKSVTVKLDATLPGVTLNLPERVRPKSTFTFSFESSLDLDALPSVRVGGQPATVTATPPDSKRSFTATLVTEGLGIDNYTGTDTDVPFDVLTDVERPLAVAVEAHAPNGNATRINAQLLLSRIVWDRPLPGQLMTLGQGNTSIRTTATDGGVEIPLASTSYGWVPAFMRDTDGQFHPFDTSIYLDGGTSRYFVPRGLDADGRLWVVTAGNALEHALFDAETFSYLRSSTKVTSKTSALARVGKRLCEQVISPPGQTCATTSRTFSINCMGTSNAEDVTPSTSFSALALGPYLVGSGENYLGPFVPDCNNIAGLQLEGIPGSNPKVISSPLGTFMSRLFPTGAGNFVIYGRDARSWDAALIDGISDTAHYFDHQAPNGEQAIAARPDNVLLTLTSDNPYSTFRAWPPGRGPAVQTGRIPGTYDYVGELNDGVVDPLPFNALVSPTNELTVLLSQGTSSLFIVNLDASLRPRWIYNYPRYVLVNGQGPSPQLVARPDHSLFYFVDTTNLRVLAISR